MKRGLWIIVSIFIFAILILGLIFLLNSEPEPSYIKGEIIVGFYDTISEEEAINLIHSYNLELSPSSPEYANTFLIKLNYKPSLSAEDGWEIRQNVSIQIEAKDKDLNGDNFIVFSSEVYAKQIIVTFNERATEETAQELIDNFDGLEIEEIAYSPKFILVGVPVGEEKKWINILEREEIVEYSELNYVGDVID